MSRPTSDYRFGPFLLDSAGFRLLRDGQPISLGPKALDLLFLLASRPAALVSKDEILAALWPDVAITDNALTQVISDVRQALGDRAGAPKYTQTVARRGMGHAKECAYTVPMILLRPTAIFQGLREDEDEDVRGTGWRCYCGVPEKAYRPDGTERPPYPEQVFLVFVNEDRVAYNWRWESADPDDLDLPENHNARFKTRLL